METSNQNSDKQKTYDFCRIEYSYLSSILFLDADEIFHCEAATQRRVDNDPYTTFSPFQQHYQSIQLFLSTLQNKKFEEVILKRYHVYSLLPKSIHLNTTVKRMRVTPNRTSSNLIVDTTIESKNCILLAYQKRSIVDMFKCWSNLLKSGPNPKSLDIGSKCPFHWNHLACKINTLQEKNNQTSLTIFSDKMYM